ncbi:proteasome subunit beta type-7 [Daktulosphaira vitifoliae]|uniref:proteasome subunit beta type-7 n=1 Tax=Daktulosphaira vitifoliae TaxID=58002 RepID=UPI0021AABFC0|nr:proteasome subunit beta type-7 [Daktulosphaira vitifoliae]
MALNFSSVSDNGAFSFRNLERNARLEKMGLKMPSFRKTGTTIVGVTTRDCVILAADTRATSDTIVMEKNCDKIHYIGKYMQCCGAGTAADTDQVTRMVSANVTLQAFKFPDEMVPVVFAARSLRQYLFKYMGYVSAALILGGVDNTGTHLYSIYPHGSIDKLPYISMGSGSMAAISELESRWNENLTEEEGKKLACDAILAGIFNDLGSGSNVDMCVIKKEGTQTYRNYLTPNIKPPTSKYRYPAGLTKVLCRNEIKFDITEESVMEVDA